MASELIGIIGGILIVAAWIFETLQGIRSRKKLVDIKFSSLFLVAAVLLAVYSWQRSDPVFFWLNIILIIILLVEIIFTLRIKKLNSRDTRKK